MSGERPGDPMKRGYAIVTLLIGFTQIIFNGGWIGRHSAPFESPAWLVVFELAWTFVSFVVLLRWKDAWSLPLAGSYVIYGSAAVVLTQLLANEAGAVTESMVPEWWKIVSVAAGLWFVAGSVFLMRRPHEFTAL